MRPVGVAVGVAVIAAVVGAVVVWAGFAGRVRRAGGLVSRVAGGRGQTGVGSARRRVNASASCWAQGQVAGSRRVAVRAWKARRAAMCSSR